MTRLEQAKRWWRNSHGGPAPVRHIVALEKAGFVALCDADQEYWLTDKGKAVIGE